MVFADLKSLIQAHFRFCIATQFYMDSPYFHLALKKRLMRIRLP